MKTLQMKPQHMLRSFIKSIMFLVCLLFINQTISSQEQDSIKSKYGLRVGIDLFTPIATFFDKDRKGLELVGDYRISNKFYVAAELGFLENISEEDFFEFTTSGSYIKAGANYNAYTNWLNMQNEIFVGARYGFSTFNQTLNSFTINNDAFFDPLATSQSGEKFENLNAQWIEFVLGIKAEVFNNLFLSFSFSGKKMISSKEPENFRNLFVPGFNRVFLNNSGFGLNYTLSYLIPLYKKSK